MSSEIGVIIGLALALAVVFLVTRPLRQPSAATATDDVALSDLAAQREAAYQILRDLDSDFQAGKLAEDDYRPMRVQALAQAAEIIAQLDSHQRLQIPNPKPVLSEVEASQTPKSEVASPKSKVNAFASTSAFCPQCGTAHAPDDVFCRKCGRALTGLSDQPLVVGGQTSDD